MGALRTAKEYNDSRANIKRHERLDTGSGVLMAPAPVKRKLFVLIHPENTDNYKHSFIGWKVINGVKIFYECANGVVRTRNEAVAGELRKQGYDLIDTQEEENGIVQVDG